MICDGCDCDDYANGGDCASDSYDVCDDAYRVLMKVIVGVSHVLRYQLDY